LLGELLLQGSPIGEPERHQLLLAIEEVGHRPLGDGKPTPQQLAVDLGDAAMVSVAKSANQGDHVQSKLALGQCKSAFLLRSASLVVEFALAVEAPTNHQPKTHHSAERGDGAEAVVGYPQPPHADRAVVVERFEPQFGGGLRTALVPGHGSFSGRGNVAPTLKRIAPPVKRALPS
jgi:hypothetical protein